MAAMREVESKLVDVLTAAVVQSPPLLKDAVLLVRDLGRKLFPLWFFQCFSSDLLLRSCASVAALVSLLQGSVEVGPVRMRGGRSWSGI